MMTRGYITIAQNTPGIDYVRQAYALALSIKNSQSEVQDFAICVTDKKDVPKEWAYAFDHIIEIPGNDDAKNETWKIQNKWKYFEMSPFDETVILDSDMIFTSSVDHWWDFLSTKNVYFTTSVHNYKGLIATSDYYRQAISENNLPNVYTAFMYFNKSKEAEEMFEMARIIYQNWEKFYFEFIPTYRPKNVSGDIVFSLAQHILGTENTMSDLNFPSFVHMKSQMMNIPKNQITENWIENIPTYYRPDGVLKVGNYKQVLPFHYHIKSWITDDIIAKLEERYNG
jgi:hypothetical protein